jgi:uncharacterized repeat protein (TIGR01451 family)
MEASMLSRRIYPVIALLVVVSFVLELLPMRAYAAGTGARRRQNPAIDLEKYVSVDGGVTWIDADTPPGPTVNPGDPVSFRITVTNTGDVELTNIALVDEGADLAGCTIPATLAPGSFFECTVGPVEAVEGPFTNTAVATATADNTTVQDTDSASYSGGSEPAIEVKKYVSVNGGTVWHDANNAPGPQVTAGEDVLFMFVVTNTGTVPLTDITLTDDMLDLGACDVPDTLEPQDSFDCVIGPFPAGDDQHTNTATAAGTYEGETVTSSDSANYAGDDDEPPVVIIIEGPVTQININIIVIYGIAITLDPDDPILLALQIGDVVRVHGTVIDDGTTIIILALTIIIIDVDIYVNVDVDGPIVWRDDGNCNNPPPPWAPAHGWRRKCGNAGYTGKEKNKKK